MDRAQFLQDLNDYLDGAASEVQHHALETALLENPEYRKLAVGYCTQDSLLEEMFEPSPALKSPGEMLELARTRPALKLVDREELARLGTPRKVKAVRAGRGANLRARQRSSSGTFWALAGMSAAAAILAVAWLANQPAKTEPPKEKTAEVKTPPVQEPKKVEPQGPILALSGGDYKRDGNTVTTDRRSTVDAKLADGSSVSLKPNTSVAFAMPTSEVRQDLEVKEGKIDVEAAKDLKTFRVRVGKSSLTVVGTRFVVEVPASGSIAGDDGIPARIEVTEGRVKLDSPKGDMVLERGSAVLCDGFKPTRIMDETGFAENFSGKANCLVLAKGHYSLLVRLGEVESDKENRHRQPNELNGRVVWIQMSDARDQGEHYPRFFEEVKVMKSPRLSVWYERSTRKLMFSLPRSEGR